jgi:hypothetical protein
MAEPSEKAAALSTICSAQVRLDHEGEAATASNPTHSTPATCVKESTRIVSTMGYTTMEQRYSPCPDMVPEVIR